MQKTFVAIAFALTLTCAFANYSPQNYSKLPVSVVADNETNFTGATFLNLQSATVGDLYLVAPNLTANLNNNTNSNWKIWFRKLDSKSLTGNGNNSVAFVGPLGTFLINNHAVSLTLTADVEAGSIPQVRAYQVPLNGAAHLPRIDISTNQNATFSPAIIDFFVVSKTAYVFFSAADKKVNATTFTIGGGRGSVELTLTAAYDTEESLNVTWGESLAKDQLIATWVENSTLKSSVVNFNNGTVAPAIIGQYDKSYHCTSYATDKKWYGPLCFSVSGDNTTYYIKTNTTNLTRLTSGPSKASNYVESYPYGPYLALIYKDTTSDAQSKYAYEIWNLDTLTLFKNKTEFLTIDDASTVEFWRVQSGGLYTLLYNNKPEVNGTVSPSATVTAVKVGLLLGSSYLASVFGFLLTIIAGLFLF